MPELVYSLKVEKLSQKVKFKISRNPCLRERFEGWS